MISITEQRDQLMALERRRQEIAAQQSAAPVTSSPSVTAAPLAASMPAAGYAASGMALKSAEPDVTKPGKGKRLPSVPRPEEAHISWAKRVLGDGYQASVRDQVDASRILAAAGLKPDDFHGGKPADDAPPGAREIARAHLAREQAMTEPASHKNYAERDITLGPAEGREPGHPQPQDYQRDYVSHGHASEAPMSGPARTNPNPAPSQVRGTVTPVALPHAHVGVQHANLPNGPRAGHVPAHIQGQFSLGSPSEK